jgi:outer membrane protein assembly factor BamB
MSQSTFHADAARTGVYPSAGPTVAPTVKWAFKTAGPIVTTPAIADGVVYIGSMSGHLYALG